MNIINLLVECIELEMFDEAIKILNEVDPSLRPPKKWFYSMKSRIKGQRKKKNQSTDDKTISTIVGGIWYNLTAEKKKEIRGREGKHYGKAKTESIKEPNIFTHTIYRIPTDEELREVDSCNLSEEKLLQGFGYTIVGRGIRNERTNNEIYQSIKKLRDLFPDNIKYKNLVNKYEKKENIKLEWSPIGRSATYHVFINDERFTYSDSGARDMSGNIYSWDIIEKLYEIGKKANFIKEKAGN